MNKVTKDNQTEVDPLLRRSPDYIDLLPIEVYSDKRILKVHEKIKEIVLKNPVNIIWSKRIDPVDAFLYVPRSTLPQTLTLEKARSK